MEKLNNTKPGTWICLEDDNENPDKWIIFLDHTQHNPKDGQYKVKYWSNLFYSKRPCDRDDYLFLDITYGFCGGNGRTPRLATPSEIKRALKAVKKEKFSNSDIRLYSHLVLCNFKILKNSNT